MSRVNVWLVLSEVAIAKYKERLQKERNNEEYTGPVKDRAFKILRTMQKLDAVQARFRGATLQGKAVQILSVYFPGNVPQVEAGLDWLLAEYPSNIAVVGAWWAFGRRGGLQLGTEYDEDGNVVGTPTYEIPNWAWRLMPDEVVLDESGNEVSRTPASSNADLRDIAMLCGQARRRFA